MWGLPRPGVKPVSPVLAGGFFTTEPPGKPKTPLLQESWQMCGAVECNGRRFWSIDIVSLKSGTQEKEEVLKKCDHQFGECWHEYRATKTWVANSGLLTSQTPFNVTVTLHTTLHPISFEADKDCFCFTSIGLLMVYSLLSRCIFIR